MYREEYPRPQWVRKDWLNLNGQWQFTFDDKDEGMQRHYERNEVQFEKKIEVPFAYQTPLSGIHETTCHDLIWYKRQFKVPVSWQGKRIFLHFGAVDYRCRLYVNGTYIGSHEGGHTNFSFDITDYLKWQDEVIALRVEDPSYDQTIPRGKQTWEEKPRIIWYTRTSGIWQTVWLEPVEECSIVSVKYTPNIDEMNVKFDACVREACIGKYMEIVVSYDKQEVTRDLVWIGQSKFSRTIELSRTDIFKHGTHGFERSVLWTPEYPHLFDVTFMIVDGNHVYDEVDSYFGLRKIHTENGMVYLNNKPYYQKLVLNQGYWREGLLTAPNDEAFVKDIELIKSMGFNGCRIHQKVEDPRFLYWADRLGFIVWGECPAFISYDKDAVHRLHKEWFEIIERDYNHPCIVTWTPINESWGVEDICYNSQQQAFALALYYSIKSLDPTRLVVSNDGWESVTTDICGVHNYTHGQAHELAKYQQFIHDLKTAESLEASMPASRYMYAHGFKNLGEPFILSEFGGIAFEKGKEGGWGYTVVHDEATFLKDYQRIMEAVYASEALHGFCYTQLSDVEQEINGLLTYDREPKCDVNKIKAINDMWHPEVVLKNK